MNRNQLGMAIGLTALALLLAGGPVAAVELGQPAPLAAHEMKDVEGRVWTLDKARGERGTLVMFICVHCPFVKTWNSRIAALGAEAAQAGIGVIAVNSNDPARAPQDGVDGMREQIATQKFGFPYVVDTGSQLARAFGAERTPEVFLFDAAGKLAYHGTIDDNAQDESKVESRFLADAIKAVAGGAKPDPAETKALGCTIKLYEEKS